MSPSSASPSVPVTMPTPVPSARRRGKESISRRHLYPVASAFVIQRLSAAAQPNQWAQPSLQAFDATSRSNTVWPPPGESSWLKDSMTMCPYSCSSVVSSYSSGLAAAPATWMAHSSFENAVLLPSPCCQSQMRFAGLRPVCARTYSVPITPASKMFKAPAPWARVTSMSTPVRWGASTASKVWSVSQAQISSSYSHSADASQFAIVCRTIASSWVARARTR